MYEYRQILVRMRLGKSDDKLAKAGLIGRRKAGRLREIAQTQGWLDMSSPLPDDAQLVSVLTAPRAQSSIVSSITPLAEQVTAWHQQGIAGTTIYRALALNHGYTGSYSAVRRFLQGLAGADPVATTVLDFAPAEAAQLDFGAGPELIDVDTFALTQRNLYTSTVQKVRPKHGRHQANGVAAETAGLPQRGRKGSRAQDHLPWPSRRAPAAAEDAAEAARARLKTLRKTARIGNVIEPTGERWRAERAGS